MTATELERIDGLSVRRCFEAEMRAAADGDMKVEGYALKFDKETMIGSSYWGWMESIAKTACDGADLSDVVFDFNHEFDNLLARTRNGSLTLKADDVGLKTVARITDTAIGRDVYAMIKDGLITKMSFWAVVRKSQWTFVEDGSEGMDSRVITEFGKFYDVAAVTFPAYEDTEIETRGMDCEKQARLKQIYVKRIEKINNILGKR